MAQVREQTLAALEEADLTVMMADGKQGLTPHDRELFGILRRSGRDFILVVNKIDGPEKEVALADFYELGAEDVLPVSAAHGYGVPSFLNELNSRLPVDDSSLEVEDYRTRVAVIGRPNVGKSSLVNKLLGSDRALVSAVPGTTRDPLDAVITRGDKEYVFVDTAGIRRKGRVSQKVEKFAVMRALRSLERADVALLLIDSVEGLTDQDAHVAGYALESGRGIILVFNKWDIVEDRNNARKRIGASLDLKMSFLSYAPRLFISAQTGRGLDKVFPVIDEVAAQLKSRQNTHQVNLVLEKAVAAHTPPYAGSHRLKFYYATQTNVSPPTFVVFANKPEKVHFSYQRYLANVFRDSFGLDKVPVRVKFKPRKKGKV